MNIFGVHRNVKSYFVRPARAIISTRYFLCLECLWEVVEMILPLREVPAAVVAARLLRHVPDVDNAIFAISDLRFKIWD